MEVFDELRRRCKAAGLRFDDSEVAEFAENQGDWFDIHIWFPRGRTTRQVYIELQPAANLVRWFLQEPFEEYAYLQGFEASWSPSQQVIECNLLDGTSRSFLWSEDRWPFGRVASRLGLELSDPLDPDERLQFASDDGLDLSIGPSSNLHSVLSHSVEISLSEGAEEEDVGDEVPRSLTLRIEGVGATRHDDAVELLERVGNALLFQIDLHLGLPLTLERELERERRGGFGLSREREDRDATSLPPVRFEYDREAMSLYWYGRSAPEMPLLRFLANYQVLEFYFPVYSEVEAQRTLRNVLKDPTFDPARDADLAKLLSAIKVGARGRTFGNESEQLEATIRHCVTADDLRFFLISEDEERYRFYTSDDAKKIVGETLPVRREADDHRGAVAKRVYAIRNRIVHTKGGFEEREPLLPFDPETSHLRHDVELVEFLARKVLVASSRPLRA